MIDFNEWVYYDETSPSCLRYKKNKMKSKIGKPCGCFYEKKRMWFVSIDNKNYLAHRVVVKLHHPEMSNEDTVCTKNGDYSKPLINNLVLFTMEYKRQVNEFCTNAPIDKLIEYKNGKLYWKVRRFSGKGLGMLSNEVGDEVKCSTDNDGYLVFKIGRRKKCNFKAHRVCYELCKGEIPDGFHIDHIDGNPANNLISNLRAVLPEVNGRNQKLNSRNKSGVIGVSYHEKENAYKAHWKDENGKSKGRSFSCNVYGKELAFTMACDCRNVAINDVNSKLLDKGYTERHGQKEDNDD